MTLASLASSLLFQAQPDFETITMTIRGEERRAIIVRPTKGTAPHPVIFGFHGHGGNGRNAARSFNLHGEWPEAIAVYPSGLPTATGRDPEGLKPGWGYGPDNRDVAFFDSLLEHVITKEKGDSKQVFVMGHSNGGGFVYNLWRHRADKLAGAAPSAAAPSAQSFQGAKPLPAFLIMGRRDPVVSYEGQVATLNAVLGVNKAAGAASSDKPDFERRLGQSHVKLWKGDARTGVFDHPGAHVVPDAAVKALVVFFKSPPIQ